jgi:glycosyltransferase involved in cell wall biosynthesis
VARRIKKYYRRKSHVIYPGTDLNKFEVGKKREDYYLIVSRLSKYKKVDLAIKACNKLRKKLVIIGEGSDKDYLKKLAGPTVEFKGFLSDEKVREYYKNAKAFIFPAEEDFGLTPIEAMASGTPVIAYKKGGLLETVKAGLSGMFFRKQTVNSLCRAIEKFESAKENFIPDRIRESAQKFALTNFKEEFKNFVETRYRNSKR